MVHETQSGSGGGGDAGRNPKVDEMIRLFAVETMRKWAQTARSLYAGKVLSHDDGPTLFIGAGTLLAARALALMGACAKPDPDRFVKLVAITHLDFLVETVREYRKQPDRDPATLERLRVLLEEVGDIVERTGVSGIPAMIDREFRHG